MAWWGRRSRRAEASRTPSIDLIRFATGAARGRASFGDLGEFSRGAVDEASDGGGAEVDPLAVHPHPQPAIDVGEPQGVLARLGLMPASAQIMRRREPMLTGGLSKPRAPLASPGEFFVKLRERMPAVDSSQPRQWLEAARERLATLRRG